MIVLKRAALILVWLLPLSACDTGNTALDGAVTSVSGDLVCITSADPTVGSFCARGKPSLLSAVKAGDCVHALVFDDVVLGGVGTKDRPSHLLAISVRSHKCAS
jgi:hypothetical protein